ncbi:MAG: BNR-4 repeat-containing protein [Clostridia bacterium]|nr:BNR-4 repeat-containing protein [Clostridia bacterium]
MKKYIAIILAIVMTLGMSAVPTFAATTVNNSIIAAEDAFTQENDPDAAYGALSSDTIITSDNKGLKPAVTKRDVYLKFDLSSYTLPTLTSAKIRLHINDVANSADRTLSIYAVDGEWSEKTITFNNAPAAAAEPFTTYLQVREKENNFWITIDITEYMNANLDKKSVSFKITSDTGATKMASKETENAPSLELSYESADTLAPVTVKFVNEQGIEIARSILLQGILTGEYEYTPSLPETITYQGTDYALIREKSTLKINVEENAENTIIAYYEDPIKVPEGVIKKLLTVSEDAYIEEKSPDDIMQNEDAETITVSNDKGLGAAWSRRDAFLRFDMSELPIAYITAARVVGYVTSATNTGERIIDFYAIEDTPWSEDTITWTNAPIAVGESIASYVVQSGTQGQWFSADVTEFLRTQGDNVSFRVRCDTGANTFPTRETDAINAFALEIKYTTDTNFETTQVKVNFVDDEGGEIKPSETIDGVLVGDYYYTKTPERIIETNSAVYTYDAAKSTLHITAVKDGVNEITLVYNIESQKEVQTSVLAVEGAWNWCADPRALRHKNEQSGSDKTYVGYIDVYGNIKAIQYDNINNTYKQVYVRTGFETDDHDNPTFLVLPDNRIMIFYSMHSNEARIYYKVSANPDDITQWGEEKIIDITDYSNATYPTPFYMSSAPESFFLLWRGVNWHPTVARLTLPDANDDVTFEITPKQIVDAADNAEDTEKRPYTKYDSDGISKIYMSYSYTHPDNVETNSLYFSYIDVTTLTLTDVCGNTLADINTAPYKITNVEETHPLVTRTDAIRNWNWETAADENGNPVILYVGISADSLTHLYYRARWTGSEWQCTYIDNGGKWFHQNTSGNEKSYSGGLCIDHNDINTVYASVPTEGVYGTVYEIFKYVFDDSGEITSKTPVTTQSQKNNFRPYVVRGSSSDDALHLVWMNGDYFYWSNKLEKLPTGNRYGFPTCIMTASNLTGFDFTDDLESIDLGDTSAVIRDLAFVSKSYNSGSVTWKSADTSVVTDEGVIIRPTDEPKTTTVTATITIGTQSKSHDYTVTVLERGDIGRNLVLSYEFDEADLYEDGAQRFIRDKSGNGNDARLMGTSGALINGALDLSQNTMTGRRVSEANSYLLAPDLLTKDLRSYTFFGRVKLADATQGYRLYDFGAGGNNSIFGRVTPLSAGIKYNAGTTSYVNVSDRTLVANTWYDLAFTYDALTRVTSVYIDGVLAASSKNIENEAIDLIGENTRNYIGRTQWWDAYYDYTAEDNPDLKGYIDNFKLYSIALNQEEIAALGVKKVVYNAVYSDGHLTASVNNTASEDATFLCAALVFNGNCLEKVVSNQLFVEGGAGANLDIEVGDVGENELYLTVWETTAPLKPIVEKTKIGL